ncbi:MAG: energy transducer TonB [Flavobacteriaceae bacterium]
MEIKKNPKVNLENYSKIFMQLGLVLALFVTYVVVEKKTFDRQLDALGQTTMTIEMVPEPPITKRPEPKTPENIPPPVDVLDVIDDDEDIIEATFETTEIDETTEINIEDIQEEDPIEDIPEDVPFISIEEVPVFPGCKGNNEELRACFNKKIQKNFAKKFDADLPNQIGLSPGKKRIIMLFKIDHTGNIIDVRIKAPHPRLQKEADRIIKLLPKMKPGRQRGKAVRVKYTLPMRVDVE